ncbi:hypothetical protein [Paraburkholderia sp. J10-1]|uniref:hypothetical protein n=1 Tax=Paraburkholderia sp. J10-1 TaxID=2805430 RepID=UPI002AB7B91C|nr:hypothetical protein [Paraburkholderia sp. J10-1]
MAGADSALDKGEVRILSSDWTGLSPFLIAKFYPVKRVEGGGGWQQDTGSREVSQSENYTVDNGFEVWAPITDGAREISMNWHSPFENSGSNALFPTLSALLQGGQAQELYQTITGKSMSEDAGSVGGLLKQAEGRTGITKLNSTQVFLGMQPVKISVTAHFRALKDPVSEVQDPIDQLLAWSVPQYLAAEGLVANAIKGGGQSAVETVFPSVSPQLIAMQYGNKSYLPLVVESVSEPITVPRSKGGVILQSSVQIGLSSLTALDRRDIAAAYNTRK